MEWEDFQGFPLDDSWYDHILSPQFEPEKAAGWSFEENKLFENALAEIAPGSPTFFENVATKVPWKSIDEIKVHYQALIKDVEMIESGRFPTPDYPHQADDQSKQFSDMQENCKKDSGSPSDEPKRTNNGQPRRRGVPWTEEEHQLFLMGLNKYGKGDWRSISRYYVITKTPTQVASHAQKYFRRQMSSTPMDRRRPSIHDIQSVNPITATLTNLAQTNGNCGTTFVSNASEKSTPFSPNFGLMAPMINPNFISYDYFNTNLEKTPIFQSTNATNFASTSGDCPIMDQASSSYPASSYFLSSLPNQQWG